MAQARTLKQREYGTDILSHPEQNVVNYDAKVRYNNTVKSSVFHVDPDPSTKKKLENERAAHFREVPLKHTATRASYQDSNIFNNREPDRGTIQPSAVSPDKSVRQRGSNTFASNIFGDSSDSGPGQRENRTYASSVFAEPKLDQPTRKKLGGESSGTATLFGEDKPVYEQSSKNNMIKQVA
jgi:hypothetical protein